MSQTVIATNNALTSKLWARKLDVEVVKQTWFDKFVGPTADSLIMERDETSKSAGDQVTYGLRMQGTAVGVVGDGTLEGNEENLVLYSDALVINQLRNAFHGSSRISQQRVMFDLREECLGGLTDWWSNKKDLCFMNQICCNTAESNYVLTGGTQNTGLQAPITVDSGHYLSANTSSSGDENLGNTNLLTLSMIDRAVEKARTISPAIRPVMVNGKRMYVLFIHDYQLTDLRTNTNTGQWLDIQKAAMTGGEIDDNPIFDGSAGVYNNTIIHVDNRITTGVNSSTASTAVANTRRAVLCGAQAAVVAYGRNSDGQKYTWVEELFDYQDKLGVSAGLTFGLKATQYNSKAYGLIVCSTYAAAH